ncbi:MAG: phage tail tip lysozyme [Candidatus Saccharimonadaceae bacterium]
MENTFASFKPIELKSSPTKDEIKQYYEQNSLDTGTDYLNSYFGIGTSVPYTSPTTTASPPVPAKTYDIREMSKKGRVAPAATPSPGPWSAPTLNSAAVNDKAKRAMDFFVEMGLTKEQAAGVAGNLHAESGFNTAIVGDSGTSYGLAQWHGPRRTKLNIFTRDNGLAPDSFEGQLKFLWQELNTTETDALAKLKETTTPTAAAKAFSDHFERPKVYNKERGEKANQFYTI